MIINRYGIKIDIEEECGLVDDTAIIGKPVRVSKSNTKKPDPISRQTRIGKGFIIGAFTVINEGTVIGDDFFLGDQSTIRENCLIGSGVSIGRQVSIEENVTIGDGVRIQTGAYVTGNMIIEDNVFIGPQVVTANDLYMKMWTIKEYRAPIFKKECSIGAGAKILPGVTIHEKAVVGMGAVVVNDVPAGRIYAGNPAHDVGSVRNMDIDS
ncbi:MAG: N-acetyltransferase [Actinobacteria bacterium]|nr:N-acetyltransferase [Actinomycetota bacterium]